MRTIDQLVLQFANSIPSDIHPSEYQAGVKVAVFYWFLSPNNRVVATVHDDGEILFSQWDESGVISNVGSAEASDAFPPELESMIRDAMREGGAQ